MNLLEYQNFLLENFCRTFIDPRSAEPRKLEPETRTVDINNKVCERPPEPIECGYNITDETECTANGGCFNTGAKPNCYYPGKSFKF